MCRSLLASSGESLESRSFKETGLLRQAHAAGL